MAGDHTYKLLFKTDFISKIHARWIKELEEEDKVWKAVEEKKMSDETIGGFPASKLPFLQRSEFENLTKDPAAETVTITKKQLNDVLRRMERAEGKVDGLLLALEFFAKGSSRGSSKE